MSTVQGDEQDAAKAFDLGVEAGLSLARFSSTLTTRLSAADRFAAAAESALAAHRARYQATAQRLARATALNEPQRTLAYAALAADLTPTR